MLARTMEDAKEAMVWRVPLSPLSREKYKVDVLRLRVDRANIQ